MYFLLPNTFFSLHLPESLVSFLCPFIFFYYARGRHWVFVFPNYFCFVLFPLGIYFFYGKTVKFRRQQRLNKCSPSRRLTKQLWEIFCPRMCHILKHSWWFRSTGQVATNGQLRVEQHRGSFSSHDPIPDPWKFFSPSTRTMLVACKSVSVIMRYCLFFPPFFPLFSSLQMHALMFSWMQRNLWLQWNSWLCQRPTAVAGSTSERV